MASVSLPLHQCLYPVSDIQPAEASVIPFKVELFLKTPNPNVELTIKEVDLVGNSIFVLSEIKRVSSSSLAVTCLGATSDHVIVNVPQEISISSLRISHYVLNHFWHWEALSIHKIQDEKEYELAVASRKI